MELIDYKLNINKLYPILKKYNNKEEVSRDIIDDYRNNNVSP